MKLHQMIEYKTATYKDFIDNESFISWRLTHDEELNKFWNNFISQNPDCSDEIAKAIKILDNLKVSGEKLEPKEKKALLYTIKQSASTLQRKRKLRIFASCAAAACLLIISGIYLTPDDQWHNPTQETIVGYAADSQDIILTTKSGTKVFTEDLYVHVSDEGKIILNEETTITPENTAKETPAEILEQNTLIVPYGRRSRLTLSDSTTIWVNSGTTLKFPTNFAKNIREINVSGEIYIEVAPDEKKPFIIHTPDFHVKVYGTKFNLSAFENEPGSVVLAEGAVGVKPNWSDEIHVKPSEKITLTEGSISKDIVDVRQYISWKDGYMIFNNTPVTEVLTKIGRYYNIAFDMDEKKKLENIKCVGKIYLSPDVNNVMKTISILSSCDVQQDGKTISLNFSSNTNTQD